MAELTQDPEEEVFRKRVEENPDDFDSWIELGNYLLRIRNFVEAEEAIRKAIELDAKSSIGWFQLALALNGKGDLDEAEKAYREVLILIPDSINAWFNLALLLVKRNDHLGAKEAYKELLNINPQDAEAWINLGVVHENLGDNPEAITAYRTSLNIDPSNPRAAFNLAMLLNKNKENEESETVLRKALDYNPFCTILLKPLLALLGINFYVPAIISANSKKTLKFGSYEAIIFGDIISSGRIQYEYVLFLYEQGNQIPIYFVSAEKNLMAAETGSAAYFLCAFDTDGHKNFGLNATLNDLEYFTKKALEVVIGKYDLSSEDMPKLD
ncbi:MAG: tetratricopeptide repeat protein [Asgard group archaeon]|nr:tetratricopeptide repeat protein [Asgard group archaeon]